jgi:malate/lactate dehydrogenase
LEIAVIGTGNVGSTLLMNIATNISLGTIHVFNHNQEKASASIMDVASAFPENVYKFHIADFQEMSNSEIIVICAGLQLTQSITKQEIFKKNKEIAISILKSINLRPDVKVILVAFPVDQITAEIEKYIDIPKSQLIGFGGDLDYNRLKSILISRGNNFENIAIIGEHGKNAIPVLPSEENFDIIANEVREYLSLISKKAGHISNLASGVLIAILIDSIASNCKRKHYICGFHPEMQTYITWPFYVDRTGISNPEKIVIHEKANVSLKNLLMNRTTQYSSSN